MKLATYNNMDGPNGCYAKLNKTETLLPHDFPYVQFKKQDKNKLIDTENKLVGVRREGVW